MGMHTGRKGLFVVLLTGYCRTRLWH